MLRLFVVNGPAPEHIPALIEALRPTPPSHVACAPASLVAASTLARAVAREAHATEELAEPQETLSYVQQLAVGADATAVVVLEPSVAIALICHALEAPVVATRLALDASSLTEIEVRLDAPWTVNRLNDRCHLGHELVADPAPGIVQT